LSTEEIKKQMDKAKREMESASKELDFIAAAKYRDEYLAYLKLWEERSESDKK
jgi:excinuclease ABC subunit B